MVWFFLQITIKNITCPQNIKECEKETYNIIHVIADSTDKRNSIHYLWSVIGSPTIIAAYFDKTDVNLTVNWTHIVNRKLFDGIQFTQKSDYITAFVIPAIYEFQDPKDDLFYTGKHVDVKTIVRHSFQDEITIWEKPEIDFKNNITTFKASMLGGTVIFQVRDI